MKTIMTKLLALFVAGMLLTAASCPPSQVTTAKDVMGKISFYSSMARALITVAEANFADNAKVKTALSATKASLTTLEGLLATIGAGIDKDEAKLVVAAAELVKNVFVLMDAIREAQSVGKAKTVP